MAGAAMGESNATDPGAGDLDELRTLPDGMVVELVADDEGDDLTDAERRALHDTLSISWKSAEAGRLRPAAAILDELRQRR
ncbi:MAG: hypothetical protein WBD07_03850 [Vicinamibacterales bacterium]